MLRFAQPLTGSQSFCSVRAATQVAVLHPRSTSVQPRRKSASNAVAGQGHDLVGGPVAVGDVAVIAEVDEGNAREARGKRAKDGEPAMT